MTSFGEIPDYSAINTAHSEAEDRGDVSPNRLPPGSVPLEETFACMDREGAIVPVEPPTVGRKNNGFDGRGRTHRINLVTTSPHTVLRETAGLEDSASGELTAAKRRHGKSLTLLLLDVLRETTVRSWDGYKAHPKGAGGSRGRFVLG